MDVPSQIFVGLFGTELTYLAFIWQNFFCIAVSIYLDKKRLYCDK